MLGLCIFFNNSSLYCVSVVSAYRMRNELQIVQRGGRWQVWPGTVPGWICLQFRHRSLRRLVYLFLLLNWSSITPHKHVKQHNNCVFFRWYSAWVAVYLESVRGVSPGGNNNNNNNNNNILIIIIVFLKRTSRLSGLTFVWRDLSIQKYRAAIIIIIIIIIIVSSV